MKLPKKISPCPIIEATVEIRFRSIVPASAIFGFFYGKIKDKYSEYEELPILELPRSILETDIKLKFQPHYRFIRDDYIIQLGPNMFSLSVRDNYPGWNKFIDEIDLVINVVKEAEIIDKVSRLGMRYIDFFENENIFDNINLQLNINNKPFESVSNYVRTEINKEIYNILIQVTNKADVKSKDSIVKKGSLVDYDLSVDKLLENFFVEYKNLLNGAHKILKEHFFLILIKEDFLKKLNPEY